MPHTYRPLGFIPVNRSPEKGFIPFHPPLTEEFLIKNKPQNMTIQISSQPWLEITSPSSEVLWLAIWTPIIDFIAFLF